MSASLLSWGLGQDGQLGIESGEQVDDPLHIDRPTILQKNFKEDIKSVACGANHSLFLLKDGRVFSVGNNEFLQLGRDGNVMEIQPVSSLPSDQSYVNVACGDYHSCAVSSTGQIFLWGLNTSGQCGDFNQNVGTPLIIPATCSPFCPNTLADRVVQVACGRKHTLLLLMDSRLLAFGDNSEGQLGIGSGKNFKRCFSSPQLVTALLNMPIRQISAGAYHSMALTPSGQVYAWGRNDAGQLGFQQRLQRSDSLTTAYDKTREKITEIDDTDSVSSTGSGLAITLFTAPEALPLLVKQLTNLGVVYVACGSYHSLFLTNQGQVFATGRGTSGQLGHGLESDVFVPVAVQDLMGFEVTQISCGANHSLALIGKQSKLYSFGCNQFGQLGLGNRPRASDSSPITKSSSIRQILGSWSKRSFVKSDDTELPRSDPPNQQAVISAIFAGGNHNFILLSNNKVSIRDFREIPADLQFETSIVTLPSVENMEAFSGLDDSLTGLGFGSLISLLFGSLACLAASLYPLEDLKTGWKRKPVGRHNHAVQLDDAVQVQEFLFSKIDADFVAKLKSVIVENILSVPRRNFPTLECLRGLLILCFNPCLKNSDFADSYHFHLCRCLNSIDAIPLSIFDEWLKTLLPRHFRFIVSNIIRDVKALITNNSKKQFSNFVEIQLKVFLDFLLRLYKINLEKQLIPNSTFNLPDLHNHIELEKDFICWLKFSRGLSDGPFVGFEERQSRSRNVSESIKQTTEDWQFPECRAVSQGPATSSPPVHVISNEAITKIRKQNVLFFCNYPFLFNGEAKSMLLRAEAYLSMKNALNQSLMNPFNLVAQMFNMQLVNPMSSVDLMPYFQIEVRRQFLIEDTLTILMNTDRKQFRKPLRIQFTGEEAVDEGGLKKEFFLLIARELFNPMYGMFRFYPESGYYWFNESTFESVAMFGLIGQICGLAIYNQIMVDLPFPLALFKKLLSYEPGLDDLMELDPVVGRSLQAIIDYEEADFEDVFMLTFVMSVMQFDQPVTIPLCPNGETKSVTLENRNHYVQLYVDQVFNKSCEKLFDYFHKGFHYLLQGADTSLQLFTPEELQALVVGNEVFDWQLLRTSATYAGEFWDNHPVIVWFWEVLFTEFTDKERKDFLRFLTGCCRVPITGMQDIKIKIQPTRGGDNFYPVAHTCYNLLDLPIYSQRSVLKDRLAVSILHLEGFTIV